jgi:hypothetical protein
MGDLIRKYIALDGYVRHYLPIRGFGTMRDTLRHYRVCDSPSFRLVQNAIDELMTLAPMKTSPKQSSTAASTDRDQGADGDVAALCQRQMGALPDFGAGDEGDLLRDVATRIGGRIDPLRERNARALARIGELGSLRASWNHLAATMAEHSATVAERTPSQQLMELELSVALAECWTRVAELDLALAGHA